MNGRLEIYTDGGADPNPGPGGWGAVILDPGGRRELSGHATETTNNRMELTAAIEALSAVEAGVPVKIHTDSTYLKNGVTKWMKGWIARGWKRKTGTLQNEDLWRRLADLVEEHDVHWAWVKGHAGHEHNERADQLATAEIKKHRAKRRATEPGAEATGVGGGAGTEIHLRVSGGPRGGWAAAVRTAPGGGDGDGGDGEGAEERLLTGAAPRGMSANELEILAAAEVLESLPKGASVAVFTGSDYLRNGATSWIHGWRANGWTTKSGKPVANRVAWERLARVLAAREVTWPSTKGRDLPGWKELGKMAKQAGEAGG